MSGAQYCQVQGACVTDGMGSYGNNERCSILAARDLYATATEFSTESCCDYLAIGSMQYRGSSGPQSVRHEPSSRRPKRKSIRQM